MALKAIIKGETNAVPSSFTLDIVALLAAAGLTSGYDMTGPWWMSLTWETTVANSPGGESLSMEVDWQSPGGQTRILGGVTRDLHTLTNIETYGPSYIVRSAPGDLWTIVANAGGVIDTARINWLFAAMPLQTPDVLAF